MLDFSHSHYQPFQKFISSENDPIYDSKNTITENILNEPNTNETVDKYIYVFVVVFSLQFFECAKLYTEICILQLFQPKIHDVVPAQITMILR